MGVHARWRTRPPGNNGPLPRRACAPRHDPHRWAASVGEGKNLGNFPRTRQQLRGKGKGKTGKSFPGFPKTWKFYPEHGNNGGGRGKRGNFFPVFRKPGKFIQNTATTAGEGENLRNFPRTQQQLGGEGERKSGKFFPVFRKPRKFSQNTVTTSTAGEGENSEVQVLDIMLVPKSTEMLVSVTIVVPPRVATQARSNRKIPPRFANGP